MKLPWTRSEIRAARQTPLKPILVNLGYRLEPAGQGNDRILGLPDEIVVKDHYWVRLDDGLAGNAIDFLVKIRGIPFKQAMNTLRGPELPDRS
jgi:hypothetical protein